MIQQTINGRDVYISRKEDSGKYSVWYEGKIFEFNERPVTDQDILKITREKKLIEIYKQCVLLGNLLTELLSPLLSK